MYELLSHGSAVSISLHGRLTQDDLSDLNTYLDDVFDRHGRLQMLVEFRDDSDDEANAFVENVRRHLARADAADRVAMVGGEVWEAFQPRLASVFPEAEVQTYLPAHLAEAWAWVRGKR